MPSQEKVTRSAERKTKSHDNAKKANAEEPSPAAKAGGSTEKRPAQKSLSKESRPKPTASPDKATTTSSTHGSALGTADPSSKKRKPNATTRDSSDKKSRMKSSKEKRASKESRPKIQKSLEKVPDRDHKEEKEHKEEAQDEMHTARHLGEDPSTEKKNVGAKIRGSLHSMSSYFKRLTTRTEQSDRIKKDKKVSQSKGKSPKQQKPPPPKASTPLSNSKEDKKSTRSFSSKAKRTTTAVGKKTKQVFHNMGEALSKVRIKKKPAQEEAAVTARTELPQQTEFSMERTHFENEPENMREAAAAGKESVMIVDKHPHQEPIEHDHHPLPPISTKQAEYEPLKPVNTCKLEPTEKKPADNDEDKEKTCLSGEEASHKKHKKSEKEKRHQSEKERKQSERSRRKPKDKEHKADEEHKVKEKDKEHEKDGDNEKNSKDDKKSLDHEKLSNPEKKNLDSKTWAV